MATAGYVQITLIWVVYAIAVAILLSVACLFVYLYQTHRERSIFVTIVCIFTITSLLATVLLLPVDVALVSSTTNSNTGQRKDWANQDKVDNITYTLRIVYYLLYSLDALLCLLVIPFTYFWYEEYDEVAQEEGTQTFGTRFWGAFKYTMVFIFLCVALFLVGFFVPVARHRKGAHFDLDFFKKLLSENHGERALTFALGLLITIGVILYCFYTAAGLAILPLTMIKSAPSISAPALTESTAAQLESNLERQRQLEGRAQGNPDGLSSKDQRELDALVREERTLRRHQRMAEEASGKDRNIFWKIWTKIGAVLRPIKLILGLLLVVVVLLIFASMLITGIDKAKNSICKRQCGYLLAHINIFQPVNWVLVKSAKVFPIDYVIFMAIVMLFFSASILGIATIGIRVLWITIFRIRKAHTSPQALLVATVLLTLMTLAINYSIAMLVAPQYATFGPQTFCDHPPKHPGEQPDCTDHKQHIIPCTESTENPAARNVCTPSVVSTFLNRVTVNFPFFGVVDFWAQFVFLGIFLLGFILLLFRTPKLSDPDAEEDELEEEEEGLLASTGRRFDATWQDITGRYEQQACGKGSQVMQNRDLSASRWASPEVRRERQSQASPWASRTASPHNQDLSTSKPWQQQAPALTTTPAAKPLSSAQRQYITRHNDLQRFRRLFRRLAWKANSLTHWSHRALNLAQQHQARLSEYQHICSHGNIEGQPDGRHGGDGPLATLGPYNMVIDPVEAERQFKIDFYEFYALLERGLVCLLGVWGVVITASAGIAPASGAATNGSSIIGDSLSFHGSAHRFHANVLSALEHPSNPLHATLGTGPVREYIGIAKEFRNKWKDVESRPDESFSGHERAEEEWDPGKMKRYEKVLRDLKLEELLGSVLRGLEEAGRQAEGEVERLEGLLGSRGRSEISDIDLDMQDAPFETMADHGGFDHEMEF